MTCLTLPETVTLYPPGFADPLQMPHPCHRFWKCYKTTKPSRFAHFWQDKQSRAPVKKCSQPFSFLHFWLRNVLRATTASAFSTSQLPKVVRSWCGFYVLTSKCASRHNGVHFFDISTSKSGPELVWFLSFDFEMCFTPQRRALFRHLNFQKWSGAGVVSPFWLRNVLRAAPACTFSTSQLPKVVRSWCALYVLTWKYASRHNGVQFHLSSGQLAPHPPLERAYFSTLWSFKSLEKHSVSRLSYLFAHLDLLFFDLLSSSLLFSDSSHLCFSFVHIVGSLISKLPSTRSTNSALGSCSSLCLSCEHRLAEVRYVGGWWLH